jgi:hypothetical protein
MTDHHVQTLEDVKRELEKIANKGGLKELCQQLEIPFNCCKNKNKETQTTLDELLEKKTKKTLFGSSIKEEKKELLQGYHGLKKFPSDINDWVKRELQESEDKNYKPSFEEYNEAISHNLRLIKENEKNYKESTRLFEEIALLALSALMFHGERY